MTATESLQWVKGHIESHATTCHVTNRMNDSSSIGRSHHQPDWTRETKGSAFEWSPYKSLLAAIRCYQATRDGNDVLSAIRWRLAVVRWRFWCVVGGISIPLRCQIGGGLQMPHTNGIVINVGAKIGFNCDIYQQVTIGDMKGCPTIGNNVFIGPGAKILGPIFVGDGARIGANALVIRNVPPDGLALAAPAEIRSAGDEALRISRSKSVPR